MENKTRVCERAPEYTLELYIIYNGKRGKKKELFGALLCILNNHSND